MKIVLTGCSSGIGQALTRHLLAAGHAVWGLARASDAGITPPDVAFRYSRADVTDYAAVRAVATAAAESWGSIDALIACAGTQGAIGPALSSPPDQWHATIAANLGGTYHTLHAFAPLLHRRHGRAKALCFSGGGATKARARFSAYGAAKTAIVRLVETIAVEEQARALDINAIAPGAINTRMTDEVLALGPGIVGAEEHTAARQQKASGGASLPRLCAMVDWLLSPASDGISGRLLSAPWDRWLQLGDHAVELAGSDIYTLRRILPQDRGKDW